MHGVDPGMNLNCSPAICVPLPVPAEPNENLPGLCFASAISSRTDFGPKPGATTST